MSIEHIIRCWKAGEEEQDDVPENPVGQEIAERELEGIAGGMPCEIVSCSGYLSCLLIQSVGYTTTSY